MIKSHTSNNTGYSPVISFGFFRNLLVGVVYPNSASASDVRSIHESAVNMHESAAKVLAESSELHLKTREMISEIDELCQSSNYLNGA